MVCMYACCVWLCFAAKLWSNKGAMICMYVCMYVCVQSMRMHVGLCMYVDMCVCVQSMRMYVGLCWAAIGVS